MKPVTIAVTGLNAVDSPGPGVPVLRSLHASSLECRLVGLAYDVLEPGIYMPDLVDATFRSRIPTDLRPSSTGSDHPCQSPAGFHHPHPRCRVDNFILVKEQLAEWGSRFFTGQGTAPSQDKTRLAESLREKGIDVPETVIMETWRDCRAMETIQFPF